MSNVAYSQPCLQRSNRDHAKIVKRCAKSAKLCWLRTRVCNDFFSECGKIHQTLSGVVYLSLYFHIGKRSVSKYYHAIGRIRVHTLCLYANGIGMEIMAEFEFMEKVLWVIH